MRTQRTTPQQRRSSRQARHIDESSPISGTTNVTIPWLDSHTSAELAAISQMVEREQPAVLAMILFGSVARHDERPLSDTEPSDVDILLLVKNGLTEAEALAIHHTMGTAAMTCRPSPRAIESLLVEIGLASWDASFVANVAHDGLLLWARGPLPTPLAAVERRTWPQPALPSAVAHEKMSLGTELPA